MIDNRQPNMKRLEEEIAIVETNAIAEEQFNVNKNYEALEVQKEVAKGKMPYSDVRKYDVGIDYDDISSLQHKKNSNASYWKELEELEFLCDDGALFVGHLFFDDRHVFFVKNSNAKSRLLKVGGKEISLIHVNDDKHKKERDLWRFPASGKVGFSRNISMRNYKVFEVDIVYDESSEIFNTISDNYLRKALLRNKGEGIQDIIQTIQKKQDDIRSLPKGRSFVVQGCAGSGKTMVLLHRINYLLYNKFISDSDYVFLVPSNAFKAFVVDASSSFQVQKENIVPIQSYYQTCLGKSVGLNPPDNNELIFPSNYLSRVYSESFLKEAYKQLFENIAEQTSNLVEFAEKKFNQAMEYEKKTLEIQYAKGKENIVLTVEPMIEAFQSYINVELNGTYENLRAFLDELEKQYLQRKIEYESAIDPKAQIAILRDDERILLDNDIVTIKAQIVAEESAVQGASIFTVASHRNKLKKLQTKYESLVDQLVEKFKLEERAKSVKRAEDLKNIFPNITLEQVASLLSSIQVQTKESLASIERLQKRIESFETDIEQHYKREIDILNNMINVTSDIDSICLDYVENLTSAREWFEIVISEGIALLKRFETIMTKEEKDYIKSNISYYSQRKDSRTNAFLSNILLKICKEKMHEEFNIKMCDKYKHYWYLALYSAFLTRQIKDSVDKHIFIDEAQDLSPMEIALVEKINTRAQKPFINLFGDINQMISNHGVRDWKEVSAVVQEQYFLEENFRNTNQIVDYCNENLPFDMVKIGVDMEDVDVYNNLDDFLCRKNPESGFVFIVKDDYAELDLKYLLSHNKINNCEIYTVKKVKGLEFKEVVVFDKGMTDNEKYISYTRALIKLNIVKQLPKQTENVESLIIQEDVSDMI